MILLFSPLLEYHFLVVDDLLYLEVGVPWETPDFGECAAVDSDDPIELGSSHLEGLCFIDFSMFILFTELQTGEFSSPTSQLSS